MNSRKNPASNWKLYCIIDKVARRNRSPEATALSLFKTGVDVIQLRYKNLPSYELLAIAKRIRKAAKRYGKTLLINDRIDVAVSSGAEGVHLGSGDLPLETAHRLLGKRAIVGKTVHTPGEAKKIRREKVNYIGVGPIFTTPLKKNLKAKGVGFIKKIKQHTSVPVFAIGGINKQNVKLALGGGAQGVCVARASSHAKALLKEIKK
ncbi:MAG: thiamine phosphate synthase [Candidatus Omnitrophica bacterium]|nr:thiamine phosphate synthase [Candidatus Omnitrophota bacterium]